MSQIDGLRRYIEAGLALGQITRSRAEEAVRGLIETGEVEGNRAQDWVENLVTANRERYEAFVSTVRTEVRSQLKEVGFTNIDELARRVANILEKGQEAARKATRRPAAKRAKKAPGKKTATKRAPAKKAAVKKTAVKKTAAKRAPAKKTAAKRAPAKKVARKAPAKKATSARKARA